MERSIIRLLILSWSIVAPLMAERVISVAESEHIERNILNLIENGLGVTEVQEYVDGLGYEDPEPIDLEVAQRIARTINDKLERRGEYLKDIKDFIEDHYNDVHVDRSQFQQCKDIPLRERSVFHNTEIDLAAWCIAGTELAATDREKEFLPHSVFDQMHQVLDRNRNAIKRVYFGSELTNYPASKLCPDEDCDEQYDPRFQPWYVTTATPKPKDVVIIIDKSGSMGSSFHGFGDETLMTIARRAAKTVLRTLNPSDRVSLVVFCDGANTPPGTGDTSSCYATQLAKATPKTVNYLVDFIDNVRPSGLTRYTDALERAFQIFNATPSDTYDTRPRDLAILMLSDGDPDDSPEDIYRTVREGNAVLGNQVVILTYGIGEIGAYGKDILRNISRQTTADESQGEIREGRFEEVAGPNDLRFAMASYYNTFIQTGGNPDEIQYTSPYRDAFDTGLQVSMCLQVIVENELKGVTCIDQPLADIVSEITYYRKGDQSYGFIIDAQMRVMTHPLLPNPSDVNDDIPFTHIPTLESGTGIDQVIQAMIGGEPGTAEVTSKRIIARGSVQTDGVSSVSVASDYFYAPIGSTGFFLCIVNARGERLSALSTWDTYPQFLYHKNIGDSERRTVGRAATRVAVCEQGSIKLAARAFLNQLAYLVNNETVNDLEYYKAYFGGQNNDDKFQPSVREIAALVYRLNDIFGRRISYQDNVIWRYFGTDVGVHFTYPGIELHKFYDPTGRTWYKRSLAYPDKFTITTPYEDAFGAGIVLTITKAIYDGSNAGDRTSDSLVVGVIALDISLTYTYHMFTDPVPECSLPENACFVVDLAGFIITHKDWIDNPDAMVEGVHMTYYEPKIAARLEEQSAIWSHQYCVNIEEVRKQVFGKIMLEDPLIEDWFEIHEVEGTNSFLVIKKGVQPTGFSCQCPIQRDSEFRVERCNTDFVCTCPCYEKTQLYLYCAGVFVLGSDDPPPCAPPVPSIDWREIALRDLEAIPSLDYCHDYTCPRKNDAVDCTRTLTCKWCISASTGRCDADRAPACHGENTVCDADQRLYEEACITTTGPPAKRPGTQNGSKDNASKDSGLPIYAIIVIALIVILLIGTVIVLTVVLVRYRRKHTSGTRRTNDDDPYDRIGSMHMHRPSHPNPPEFMQGRDNVIPMAHQAPRPNRYDAPPTAHSTAVDSGYLTHPDITRNALYGQDSSGDEHTPASPPPPYQQPPKPCPTGLAPAMGTGPGDRVSYEKPQSLVYDNFGLN